MFRVLAVLAILFAPPVLADWDDVPEHAQTLTPDAASDATFTGAANGYYTVQCTGAFYLAAGDAVTSTTGRYYDSAANGGTAYVRLRGAYRTFSVISSSGSISCYVFRHGQ